MKYVDYDWDLNSERIILDEEINTDKLGWKHGDIFRFINIDGRQILQKVEPIEVFVRGYKPNV